MILMLPRQQTAPVAAWPEVQLHKCWNSLAESAMIHNLPVKNVFGFFFDKRDIGLWSTLLKLQNAACETLPGRAG